MILPDSIKHPDNFIASPSYGFDGVFDWAFTKGALGFSKITPMDIDGIIERKGKFLVFETKDIGKDIPKGQMITFEQLYKLGVFTILFVQGKIKHEKAMAWCQPGFLNGFKHSNFVPCDDIKLNEFTNKWYRFSNK